MEEGKERLEVVMEDGGKQCLLDRTGPLHSRIQSTCVYLAKVQPVNILSWDRGARESHHELKSYGQLVASDRGQASFL